MNLFSSGTFLSYGVLNPEIVSLAFNFPLATLTFPRSYRESNGNPFVWLRESIASTRASNLPFKVRRSIRKIRGSITERRMHREARRLGTVICTVSSTNPAHSPRAPLNQLAISPARFVSPATNKQQNEPRPYLASATIARETRQIPDSESLLD